MCLSRIPLSVCSSSTQWPPGILCCLKQEVQFPPLKFSPVLTLPSLPLPSLGSGPSSTGHHPKIEGGRARECQHWLTAGLGVGRVHVV